MKRKRVLFPRAYYAKMVLLTSAAIMLTVVVLTFVVMLNTQNVMVKKEYASNSKILMQVRNNIHLMDQMIANLCRYLYLSSDMGAIMYARDENMADIVTRLNRIVSAASSANPFFHSITIYNKNLDQFYGAGAPLANEDQMLSDFVKGDASLPRLQPVFREMDRVVGGYQEREQLFSYFFYEISYDSKLDGIVAINMKLEWLLDNIKQINQTDSLQQSQVFVLDHNGRFWEDETDRSASAGWIKEAYTRHKADSSYKASGGYFREQQDGVDYLITYADVANADVTLIKTQPLSEVYTDISRLWLSVLLIAGIVLVVALFLSFGISKNLYRPIGKLVHTISTDGSRRFSGERVNDEIEYLNQVYKQSMERLDLYDQERYQYKDVMKHYWLNRLLFENLVMKPDEQEALFQEMRISLPVREEYALLYLKLDHYKEFRQRFNDNEAETIRFALLNIASEIIGRTWSNEGLDLKEDHVVLICAVNQGHAEQWSKIEQEIAEIRNFFTNAFHLSFTASVSERTDRLSSLPQLYKQASEQAGQRFFVGHGRTFTTDTAFRANSLKGTYSQAMESRLVEAISARSPQAAQKALGSLFREIEAMAYSYALVSVIKLNEAIKLAFASASISDYAPSIGHFLHEKETLQEIHEAMNSVIEDAVGQDKNKDPVNHYLVDAVLDYINQHYCNESLSLTSIAAVMKTPSRRLSKLVKETKGISVNDCINEIRLAESAKQLVHTDLAIHEIVKRVGIPSETYFFTLFKKHYGTSPKEYAHIQRERLYKNKGLQ
jgi:YesN/AraC family two-component response regulator